MAPFLSPKHNAPEGTHPCVSHVFLLTTWHLLALQSAFKPPNVNSRRVTIKVNQIILKIKSDVTFGHIGLLSLGRSALTKLTLFCGIALKMNRDG